MKVEIISTESRLEIATKILNWNPQQTTPLRVSEELDIRIGEFFKMDDEEFFNTLYSYVHNRDYSRGI